MHWMNNNNTNLTDKLIRDKNHKQTLVSIVFQYKFIATDLNTERITAFRVDSMETEVNRVNYVNCASVIRTAYTLWWQNSNAQSESLP